MFLHLPVILFAGVAYPSMQWVQWQTPPGKTPHPTPETVTEAGGAHPTGMHSCSGFHRFLEKNWKPNYAVLNGYCTFTLVIGQLLQL